MTTTSESSQRNVDTLLKLGTYQGMSDAEIQSIIDYKTGLAYQDGATSAVKTAADDAMAKLLENNETARQTAAAAFDNAVLSHINFTSVGGES